MTAKSLAYNKHEIKSNSPEFDRCQETFGSYVPTKQAEELSTDD